MNYLCGEVSSFLVTSVFTSSHLDYLKMPVKLVVWFCPYMLSILNKWTRLYKPKIWYMYSLTLVCCKDMVLTNLVQRSGLKMSCEQIWPSQIWLTDRFFSSRLERSSLISLEQRSGFEKSGEQILCLQMWWTGLIFTTGKLCWESLTVFYYSERIFLVQLAVWTWEFADDRVQGGTVVCVYLGLGWTVTLYSPLLHPWCIWGWCGVLCVVGRY